MAIRALLIAALASAVCAQQLRPWSVVASGLLTTALGVAFEDEKVGYLAGDANGAGPEILRTTDGGLTFNSTQANFGIDLLLLGAAAAKETVIVSSIFGELYSTDGTTFHQSLGGGLSQSVRYLGQNGDGGHKFGCAGTYRGKQGVAVTTNSGRTFKADVSDKFYTEARYAAFPSDTTWYVAAGQFPSTNQSDVKMVRARRSAFLNEDGSYPKAFGTESRAPVAPGNDNGYKAQIVKTTDGGATWTTLWGQNGTIYMNGIDCTSETHCCAVGESSDAPAAGAYVYCTFDGRTWNQTFAAPYQSRTGYSLIDIRFANDTFGWAVGGELDAIEPKAWFLETSDGGKTWDAQKHELPGFYALGLDVVDNKVAYAAVDNLITQQSGLAKYLGTF